jgi:hypothetical protein
MAVRPVSVRSVELTLVAYSTIKERKEHNMQVVNVCYKQYGCSRCTAVQSVLAYLSPTAFSATTMEFSQSATDSPVTVDNFLRKISFQNAHFLYVSCALTSRLRKKANINIGALTQDSGREWRVYDFRSGGGLATAYGLLLSSSKSVLSASEMCRSSSWI